jgi:hypothetical protein
MQAEGEVGLDPLLDGHRPQFLEAADLALGEGLHGEFRQRRPPPQPQRIAEQATGLRRRFSQAIPPAGEQLLEPAGVDVVGATYSLVPSGLSVIPPPPRPMPTVCWSPPSRSVTTTLLVPFPPLM